jgi:hypothetical protein
MRRLARFVAAILCFAGLMGAAAALVREGVLATEQSAAWPLSSWWTNLPDQPSWQTGIPAAVAAALAAAFIFLAVRLITRPRHTPEVVELAGEQGTARLRVDGVERAVGQRLRAELEGVAVRKVELRPVATKWRARVEAGVPMHDLLGLQRRATAITAAALAGLGGLELEALDVVVVGVMVPAASRGGKKEDLGITRSS